MNRPTRMVFLSLCLGAAVVQAQTQTAPGTAPESSPDSSTNPASTTTTAGEQVAVNGPQVQAEIVSVDAAGKTITVRESAEGEPADAAAKSASPATLPVEGKAIARLGVVKAGNRVTLICAGPGASTSTTSSAASGADPAAPSSSAPAAGSAPESATGTTSSAGATSAANPEASSPPAAGAASTSESTAAASATDASSQSALQATCGSVVEIAKARATTTSPQP